MQDIKQVIDICAPYDKMNKVQDYLRSKPRGYKTIVFCGTKRMCDQVRALVSSSFTGIRCMREPCMRTCTWCPGRRVRC